MLPTHGCIQKMDINASGSMRNSIVMEVREMLDLLKKIHSDHGVMFCVDYVLYAWFCLWLVKSRKNPKLGCNYYLSNGRVGCWSFPALLHSHDQMLPLQTKGSVVK